LENFVVHLYLTPNFSGSIPFNKRFFKLPSVPLAGLLKPTPALKNEVPFELRPFQIQQDNFYMFIQQSMNLNVTLIKIELEDMSDFEIVQDIYQAFKSNNIQEVKLLVEHLKREDIEVKSLSFYFEGRQYTVTKYGVLEITGEWIEIPQITESSPLAYITGTKVFPKEGLDNY